MLSRTEVFFAPTGERLDYLGEIRQFPMLTPQEEYLLARNWREHGDREAAHRLVTSHLRLVVKVARGYRGYGLPVSEMISEGNIGLMNAIKRFEPEKGFRFATYAIWSIKAAIQEYILRSWSLVKTGTTAKQKKLFFNLRKAKRWISALEAGDMRPDQVQLIAKRLGVTEQAVVAMNRRLAGDLSLNSPIREGDSDEWQNWLVDDNINQETWLAESEQTDNRCEALCQALTALDERELRIFEARRLADEPMRLGELAHEFDISRERVRQLEARAFEKVQKAVKTRLAAMDKGILRPSCDRAATTFWRDGRSHFLNRAQGFREPGKIKDEDRAERGRNGHADDIAAVYELAVLTDGIAHIVEPNTRAATAFLLELIARLQACRCVIWLPSGNCVGLRAIWSRKPIVSGTYLQKRIGWSYQKLP